MWMVTEIQIYINQGEESNTQKEPRKKLKIFEDEKKTRE